MTKDQVRSTEEALSLEQTLRLALEALEKLWNIIDDIDTYSDMAKADEKLYRSLVERRQRQRFEETGISTDGYELHGGAITAIKAALSGEAQTRSVVKDEPVAWRDAAIRLGEELSSVGPDGYYDMDAKEWLDWAIEQNPRGKHSLPQRTWVGLTVEEKQEWIDAMPNPPQPRHFMVLVNAIESELKEKNYD